MSEGGKVGWMSKVNLSEMALLRRNEGDVVPSVA